MRGDSITSKNPPTNRKKRNRIPKEVFDLMDAVCSPIITYPSSWKESIPESVLKNIKIARMVALAKGEKTATIPEVVAHIFPATMQAPMDSHWTNIYLYASRQYIKQYQKVSPKDFDFLPESISDYDSDKLNRLRNWIYEKRREALRKRI